MQRGTEKASRMMRRWTGTVSSVSFMRARTRAKAAVSPSRVRPSSSNVGGGRGNSSGSFSYMAAAAFSNCCISEARVLSC